MDIFKKFSEKGTVIRRIVLVVITIIIFSLQATGGLFPAPFGINAVLLIPLVVCIAMYEREFAGLFFGILAGAMLDAFNASTVCYCSIFFTIIGFASGALITYLMRNNLVCAVILTAFFTMIYNTLYFLFFFAFNGIEHPFLIYIAKYFLSAVYTTVLTPLFYLAVRGIYKKSRN